MSSPALQRYQQGATSAHMGLMELLIETEDVDSAERLCSDALARAESPESRARLESVLSLLRQRREGCERIAQMLRSHIDTDEPANSVEEGLAFARRLFDWSVQQSEEASVALYSFGASDILHAATREVVSEMEALGVLGTERDALEVGCGIGRLQRALSPRLRSVVGVDVSGNMVEAARRRCAELANVRLLQTEGRDLSQFADHSFDLVFAVDSFPYLVQAGRPLVERHFHEAARVLRRGGDLVIFSYAYGRDDATDIAEVQSLARAAGLNPRALGARPFKLWDAASFHLKRERA